jgi:hypothetical protein
MKHQYLNNLEEIGLSEISRQDEILISGGDKFMRDLGYALSSAYYGFLNHLANVDSNALASACSHKDWR